jgi:hypothetical protein
LPARTRDGGEHGQQHPPRGRARVHFAAAEVEDAQRHLLGLQSGDDAEQVGRGPRQTVDPRHHQRVPLPHEVQGGGKLIALPHRRRLLTEQLRATRCSQRRLLRLQARHLIQRAGPRITYKHMIFLAFYHKEDATPSPVSHGFYSVIDKKSPPRCVSHGPRTCGTLSHSPQRQFNDTPLRNRGRDQMTTGV